MESLFDYERASTKGLSKALKERYERAKHQSANGTHQGSIEEDKVLADESDDKFLFRWLLRTDYAKGFPSVLAGLTKGTEYSESMFHERFDEMLPIESHNYKIVVIEDKETGMIIGSGSIIMERKFIRNAGIVS